jgi:serine/threonine-protein kinase
VLLPEYSRNEEVIARFFNEAKAAARLDDPAFVEVLDCGTVDGNAFIIMEYLRGESLGTRLDRLGALPIPMAVELTRQIASAMALAHENGIIHRDLKPDNVMIEPHPSGAGEQIKVLDFGIAKLSGADRQVVHTRTGAMIGTPLFMSPEQCRGGGGIDHRSDIYSLGCILYALLTGGPPFRTEFGGELIVAHLSQSPPPLRPINPAIAAKLEALVLRALAKEPGDRPQTMQQFATELAGLATTAADPAATQLLAPAPAKTALLSGGATSRAGGTTLSRTASEMLTEAQVPTRRGRGLALVAVLGGATIAGMFAWRGAGSRPAATAAAAHVPAATSPPAPMIATPTPPVPTPPPPAASPPAPSAPPAGAVVGAAKGPVIVRLGSTPAGARVVDLDKHVVLGVTPFERPFPRGPARLHLQVEQDGYQPQKLRVPLDQSAPSITRHVELKPEASPPPPADQGESRKL